MHKRGTLVELSCLVHQLLDCVLDGDDLCGKLLRLASGDAGGNDGPRDVASTSERGLGGQENVGDVLEG